MRKKIKWTAETNSKKKISKAEQVCVHKSWFTIFWKAIFANSQKFLLNMCNVSMKILSDFKIDGAVFFWWVRVDNDLPSQVWWLVCTWQTGQSAEHLTAQMKQALSTQQCAFQSPFCCTSSFGEPSDLAGLRERDLEPLLERLRDLDLLRLLSWLRLLDLLLLRLGLLLRLPDRLRDLLLDRLDRRLRDRERDREREYDL